MKHISFCITCKNRFHQISKTLPANLDHNKEAKEMIEFVLVDFASTDGLQNWVLNNFNDELETGYLSYYFTDQMEHWHASIAKNTSHYHAKGIFLVNLDGDNFTGKDGGAYIYSQFQKYGEKLLLHQFSGTPGNGTYGRIGVHTRFFHELGGYDEAFEPMGTQDTDLLSRLREFGLTYKRFSDPLYSQAIPNTKTESIRLCQSKLSWNQMERKNLRSSSYNVYSGKLIANQGIFGYRDDVLKYHHGKLIPVSGPGQYQR
jgi:hypothetical protein